MVFSKSRIKEYILNATILFTIFLNNSLVSQQIIIFFFFLTAILYGNFKFTVIKIIFLILITTTLTINIYQVEVKSILRLLQIILGFLVFPLRITLVQIKKKIIRLIIAYISFLTFLDIFNSNFFFEFRDYFYPTDANPWALAFDHSIIALSNRYGSIFYNPNILGQSMLLVYLLYLLICYNEPFKKLDILFLILNIFCILVSGSRTAFVVTACVTFFYFFYFYKSKKKYFLLMLIIPVSLTLLANTRLLNINNDSGDSMGLKTQILLTYLESITLSTKDLFLLLFGWLRLDIQFDNDIGNIIYYIGLLGLLFIVVFYFVEFFLADFRVKYFYSFLLVSIGATLIINFKFFILTIIILSLIRSLSKELSLQRKLISSL